MPIIDFPLQFNRDTMFQFDFTLLAQSQKIINWFTPPWILSVGVAAGLILVLLFIAGIWLLSRIPGINAISEKKGVYWGSSIVLTALLFGGGCYFLWGFIHAQVAPEESTIAILLASSFWMIASILLGFGFWRLISRNRVDEVFIFLREGFLSWVAIVCTVLTGFAIVGLVLGIFNGFGVIKFVDDPRGMLMSIGRLPFSGVYIQRLTIEPTPDNVNGEPVPLVGGEFDAQGNYVPGLPMTIDPKELQGFMFRSNQNLHVSVKPIAIESNNYYRIPATSVESPSSHPKDTVVGDEKFDKLYIANRGKNPAEVEIAWQLQPAYPEVILVPQVAVWTFGLFAIYLSFMILTPKITAIGLSTFKTEVSQPVYILVLIIGALFIVGSIYVPYNTLGEDIKMYKDSGLTLLRVIAIFAAIWASSKSVAEEIEGRTALTVLSKPVGRRQFILGKIFGISSAMALLFIVLGIWFFFWVSYKPVYDAVEIAAGDTEWTNCFREALHVTPALLLAFLEVVVFVAISVAISTRVGVMGNLMLCFSIYVLGHLTPLIVVSNELGNAVDTVRFFGQFVSIVFPVLLHFDVQTAINTNQDVPWVYLGWCTVYTSLYGAAAVLVALISFEDRDLA